MAGLAAAALILVPFDVAPHQLDLLGSFTQRRKIYCQRPASVELTQTMDTVTTSAKQHAEIRSAQDLSISLKLGRCQKADLRTMYSLGIRLQREANRVLIQQRVSIEYLGVFLAQLVEFMNGNQFGSSAARSQPFAQ